MTQVYGKEFGVPMVNSFNEPCMIWKAQTFSLLWQASLLVKKLQVIVDVPVIKWCNFQTLLLSLC